MQIEALNLYKYLQTDVPKFGLIYGSCPVALRFCQKLYKHALKRKQITLDTKFVDNNFDYSSFIEDLKTPNLFSPTNDIFLFFLDNAKYNVETLDTIAQNLNPENHLIISKTKLSTTFKKSTLYKFINDNGIICEAKTFTAKNINLWLNQLLQIYKIKLKPNDQTIILNHCYNNAYEIWQLVEKLKYLNPENIDTNTLIAIANNQANYSIYDLENALLANNPKDCIKIITNLEQNYIEPSLVLWQLSKFIRVNLMLSFSSKQQNNIFNTHKIWPAKQNMYKNFSKKLSYSNWQALQTKCVEIDSLIKGVTIGNVWSHIDNLCLELVK